MYSQVYNNTWTSIKGIIRKIKFKINSIQYIYIYIYMYMYMYAPNEFYDWWEKSGTEYYNIM